LEFAAAGKYSISNVYATSERGSGLPSTLVCAEHLPVTLRLPFTPASVSVARLSLKHWLDDQGGSIDTVEDARLVVSELVGNSVRHAEPLADGNLLVSWLVEPRGLRISVTDGGAATRPRTVHAATSALAGRGMAIVETLALSWWPERSDSRSTVHAVLAF
jgi:serine/threonine-protein kinase RsbW